MEIRCGVLRCKEQETLPVIREDCMLRIHKWMTIFFLFFLFRPETNGPPGLFIRWVIEFTIQTLRKKKSIVELEKVKFECISWPYLLYFFNFFLVPHLKLHKLMALKQHLWTRVVKNTRRCQKNMEKPHETVCWSGLADIVVASREPPKLLGGVISL